MPKEARKTTADSTNDRGIMRQRGVLKLVEPDSEIRKLLKDRATSDVKKYMWLTSGDVSFIRFLYFELLTFFVSGMRGALGIYLRQKLYPRLLKECGRGVVFGRNVTLRHPHRISLGDNVVIDDNVVLDAKGEHGVTIAIGDHSIIGRNSALVCKGGTIEIDPSVNISVNCTVISESQIFIGEKTLIGGHCYMIAGGNHGIEFNGVPFVDQSRIQKGGVSILENCWLGAQSTVLDGTKIGPNAVVGAAALVNRDVDENMIVAGVPAEPIAGDSKMDSKRRRAR